MTPTISVITPVRARSETEAEWLRQAIASVLGQSFTDWEMVIINDGSPYDLSQIAYLTEDERIRWYRTKGLGTPLARNHAANKATADLLLPLDADDKLKTNALARFMEAWENGGSKEGIVYSDVLKFDQDMQRYYRPPEYDFDKMLRGTFMTIGCLHRKSDWQRVGGWHPEMKEGLEDWEYWLRLGEAGVCGYHVPEVLYLYRQVATGRTANLMRDERARFTRAYQQLRELHLDTFNGRKPMGCCGGRGKRARRPARRQAAAQVAITGDMVLLRYTGSRKGGFRINGPSGKTYNIGGKGSTFRADSADAQFLRGMPGIRAVQPKRIAPRGRTEVRRPAPVAPRAPRPPMLSQMTVAEIKVRNWGDFLARELLEQEKAGKARKTVIRHFEAML